MKNLHLFNCNEIRAFLETNKDLVFEILKKEEKYALIREVWFGTKYRKLSRKDKHTVITYLRFLTGYRRSQIMILLRKAKDGKLRVEKYHRHIFPKKYTDSDVALLAETDGLHLCLNSKATRDILRREYEVFKHQEYQKLAEISSSHIYNLRKTNLYRAEYNELNYTKTTPSAKSFNIGERACPEPNGKPGYIRVDSVHQGDFEKEKGVYHINSVDEITQWELVGAVEKITDRHLLPLLINLIASYPFKIYEFHADNGSEYINRQVARMLNKLLIRLTKSRPRRSNDNALVESKNGSVIRKHMGRVHIPGCYAEVINEFYIKYFNPYLNYHRPSGYPSETIISRYGKIKKVYNEYMPPYEKLKSLPLSEQYLKGNISFAGLDKIAYAMSDNEAAKLMQKEKEKLFEIIHRKDSI